MGLDVRLSQSRRLVDPGHTPEELNQGSHLWNGPPILYKPVEEWGLQSGLQKEEVLPGEKMCSTAVARADPPLIVYDRFCGINY